MKPSLRHPGPGGASLLASSLAYAPVQAAELHVLISGGFSAAYEKLGPQFTAATGNTLVTEHGPSMGKSAQGHSQPPGAA